MRDWKKHFLPDSHGNLRCFIPGHEPGLSQGMAWLHSPVFGLPRPVL